MRNATLAFCTLALAAGASAQMPNWRANPLYGTITLSGGFAPDPHVSTVEAGGSSANPVSGTGCTGYLNLNAPDLDLNYSSSGTLPLTISAHADRDVSLLVYTPDGRWLCDDDSGEGLDPMITISSPRQGNYNVWVGTYAAGSTVRATVGFSELGRTPTTGKTKG